MALKAISTSWEVLKVLVRWSKAWSITKELKRKRSRKMLRLDPSGVNPETENSTQFSRGRSQRELWVIPTEIVI